MAINWNEIQQLARGPSPATRIKRVLSGFTYRLEQRGYSRGEYHSDVDGILHFPQWKFEQGDLEIGYAAYAMAEQPITSMVLIRCINIDRKEDIGKGSGRKVLNDLIAIADELGVSLITVVDPAYFGNRGLSESEIIAWLVRHGFNRWDNHGLNMHPARLHLPVFYRKPVANGV